MNTKITKGVAVVCLCISLFAYNYCPIHGQKIDDASSFGYINQSLGTADSLASGTTQQMSHVISLTPVQGRSAEEYVDLDFRGRLMENKEEVRNG